MYSLWGYYQFYLSQLSVGKRFKKYHLQGKASQRMVRTRLLAGGEMG